MGFCWAGKSCGFVYWVITFFEGDGPSTYGGRGEKVVLRLLFAQCEQRRSKLPNPAALQMGREELPHSSVPGREDLQTPLGIGAAEHIMNHAIEQPAKGGRIEYHAQRFDVFLWENKAVSILSR